MKISHSPQFFLIVDELTNSSMLGRRLKFKFEQKGDCDAPPTFNVKLTCLFIGVHVEVFYSHLTQHKKDLMVKYCK